LNTKQIKTPKQIKPY